MKYLGILLLAVIALAQDEYDCPSPGGAFPHPIFCDYYYVCAENVGTLEQCPATQLFDLVYSGCNWDYLVDCGNRLPPTPGTNLPPGTTLFPGDGEFICPAPGGAFPHPLSCQHYYVCVLNEATLNTCPEGQLFDLVYNGCNWDYLVDCGNRPLPGGSTPPPGTGSTPPPVTGQTPPPGTVPPPGEFECPLANGLFPNPDDCTSFYSCSNFISSLQACPEGLYFKVNGSVCDFPENVDCGNRPIPSRK